MWLGRYGGTGTRLAVRRNPRRQEKTVHGDNAPFVQASELQASLARGIGQRLDAAVVAVAGTVEGNLLDARRPGLLGDGATDLGGGLDVLVALQAVADVGLRGAGRGEHLRAVGADKLQIGRASCRERG